MTGKYNEVGVYITKFNLSLDETLAVHYSQIFMKFQRIRASIFLQIASYLKVYSTLLFLALGPKLLQCH